MVAAACPRCERAIALHEGRPRITASGSVELWHDDCWNNRDLPLVVRPVFRPITQLPPKHVRSFRPIAVTGALGGAALLAVVLGSVLAGRGPEASQIDAEPPVVETARLRTEQIAHEIVPPKPAEMSRLEDAHPIPELGGKPLDATFPSLHSWLHPITKAGELMPANPERHFGAHRGAIERTECGGGHCGVDLDGPLGRPLVAVADGVLITVERRERGPDGLSGRFVRIQHDDGTLTSYMHMDEIDEAFQPGDRVRAGQYIGTLGMTAVEVAHLHFALEVPNTPGSRETTFASTHFVDPAPFLVRATIVESAVRRHATKPAL